MTEQKSTQINSPFSPILYQTIELMTKGKSSEQIRKELAEGKWPHAISPDQMREDLKVFSRTKRVREKIKRP